MVITLKSIKLFEAVKRMRMFTSLGIPFSFSFLSFNSSTQSSDGIKTVSTAQLRLGYREDQSELSNILIGYTNQDSKNRWFYLPLLVSFNGITIKP